MCDLQVHRGPDDRGVTDIGRVCLGSNRLAIIDLSAAGHMPMTDGDGWWITYNGEIYNFQEVREELIRHGHQFKSRTDTEVVLHSFREWGEACLDRFRGMFAFALYDSKRDRVILVRDRYGKKPLYYMRQNGHLLFASELKALASVCAQPEPNFQRLTEWSLYRNVDFGGPETLFAGISALPAGHLMEIQSGEIGAARQYYAPETKISAERYIRFTSVTAQSLTEEVGSLIAGGVRDRLISDVPVGTLCSGGLDSSLITAICARDRKDVLAFNVAVEGYDDLNESVFAERVAKSLGIKLLSCRANGEVFRDTLVRAIYHSDQPLTHPNSVFFLKVSELAHSHGVKVLLSGEAADELFGGYVQRYRRYRQLKRLEGWLRRLPVKMRRLIALAGYASERVPITEFSEYEGLLVHATSFVDRFARVELRGRCAAAYSFVKDESDREVLGAMLADVTNFLTPLLRRLDRMTMAASVECRVPFLDHRLVEMVSNVPLSLRLRGRTDKWILKAVASDYLPSDIVHRKKVGFPLPVADYLAPLAREAFFEDGFCLQRLGMHRAGMMEAVVNWRDNVNGFFNLLALEIWGRLFFFRQTVDEVNDHVRRAAGAPTRDIKARRAA
jgi:asparagine synthase (glutamine-hydrolysing)